jgi:CheY-like chemotaxis protein
MSLNPEMKILIAEDSKITLKMEKKLLKELGFNNILEAVDGEMAIRILREEREIDLVISDWNMPNRGGYDLLVWIRADEKCREIPFIMATAQSEKRQTMKATEAGASNFITKPFSKEELLQVIEETFGVKDETANESIEDKNRRRITDS